MTQATSGKSDRPSEGGKTELTAEELIDKLKKALGKDGDFPASAKAVTELRMLAADPNTTANQITEIILKEPSLGTRVLHLVNSSFYHRGTPIMTVSQAVLRIGMKPLAELCAGLVLLQKFVPASRRGGAFAGCLRKMVLTSLLASNISTEIGKTVPTGKTNECGYMAGALSELGTLLLAYYFPQIYEGAVKRAETKKQDIGKSIFEITGVTPLKLSLEVLEALHLPDYYKEVLRISENPAASAPPGSPTLPDAANITRAASALNAAQNISTAVAAGKPKRELDAILGNLKTNLKLDDKIVRGVLGNLPKAFNDHCAIIEIDLPQLPDYVSTYSSSDDPLALSGDQGDGSPDPFKQFVDEIRIAVESREPTASIITTVMETLAFGLKFDRVLLLLVTPSKNSLVGRMLLGQAGDIDPKKISRPIGIGAHVKACEAIAFAESRPVYRGTPVLEGGWPIVAIPIGSGNRAIGVIYADRNQSNDEELSNREQAAIGVLVELLDKSTNIHS